MASHCTVILHYGPDIKWSIFSKMLRALQSEHGMGNLLWVHSQCTADIVVLEYHWWCGHDEVIKRKKFPCYWPFVWGIHRSPVNSPHKGQWRGASMFSLICTWINGWANNPKAGDLRHHHAHYDVTVMFIVVCDHMFSNTISWHGNIFCITGPSYMGSHGHWLIASQGASNVKFWCFLCC